MFKVWRFLNVIVSVLLPGLGCFGQMQATDLAFETIGPQKGLTHHIVYCLLQDRRGFIWAGTDYGLNRYDGLNCTPFFAQADNTNSLSNNHINRLAEDAESNIWAGTSRGISRHNPTTGQWAQFFTTEKDRVEMKDPGFNVFTDRNGQLWAANGYFLLRFNHNQQTFSRFPVDCGQSSGNTRNYFILDFLHDSKGTYWLATSYGVKKFDSTKGIVKSYHFPEKNIRMEANAVTSLAEAPDGRVIAGTWGGGILAYNPAIDQFEPLDILPGEKDKQDGLHIVLDIAFTGNILYLGTSGGLLKGQYPICINPELPNQWQTITKSPDNDRSLPGGVVYHVLADKTQNLWLATNNNIARTNLRFSSFINQPISFKDQAAIIPSAIVPNQSDATHQSYWLGASGLFLVNPTKNTIEKVPLGGQADNNLQEVTIWDMVRGKTALWLGTSNGLFAFDEKNKRVKSTFVEGAPSTKGIAGSKIWNLFEDKDGNIWVGTIRKGISKINPTKGSIQNFFTDKHEKYTLFNKTTSQFFESRNGDIWFGANERLYHYQKNKDAFHVYPFSVRSKNGQPFTGKPIPFLEDEKGKLWIAFNDGIVLLDISNQKFEPLLMNPLYFKPDGDIVALQNGSVWMGTNNGLFRLDTADVKLTRYTTNDGLISNETGGCLSAMPDGSLVMGSMGYLTRFYPSNLSKTADAPAMALARVQVNGRDTAIHFSKVPIWAYQSTILFEFAALSFNNAGQNQYQYMLKGADKSWNPVTNNPSVTYAQLPAGQYTFLVKGSNSDGVWNPEPVAFPFKVEAPFYLKGWFIALSALVIAGLVIGFYRYRLAQALRLERLRTRLATDLHDDVGATLSAISMYSDALKKQVDKPQLVNLLDKMGEDSREMVRTMGDLVWAINPKNDGGDKLVQRMENYATDLCASKELPLHFEKEPGLNALSIGIETRRNIFLIFKEALNNALKYSEADQMKVKILKESNKLMVTIYDNGKGFDTGKTFFGNGLNNMRTRAAEIHATFSIESSPSKGCTILLQCPL